MLFLDWLIETGVAGGVGVGFISLFYEVCVSRTQTHAQKRVDKLSLRFF